MLRPSARGQKCDPSPLWQTPLWREDQLEIHLRLAAHLEYRGRYHLTTDSDRQLAENFLCRPVLISSCSCLDLVGTALILCAKELSKENQVDAALGGAREAIAGVCGEEVGKVGWSVEEEGRYNLA